MKLTSVSVTDDYFKNIDLTEKKQNILEYLKKIPNLEIKKTSLWESRYWGKGVGAYQLEGVYRNHFPVIIKIQGAKPKISEVIILDKLHSLKEKKIKFPKVIFYLPWSNKRRYEIIVFEKINANFIIYPHQLAKKNQIEEFFNAYKLYKNFSQKIKPFIKKPQKKFSYLKQFLKWRQIRLENKLNYLITKSEDERVLKIAKKIDSIFQKVNFNFQHCHLSIHDIKKASQNYYFFSNLFWGWRWPYYDAVFGFMWYILGISQFKESAIINQIHLWEKYILKINEEKSQAIISAIIERLLAGLNLDILMINKKNEILKLKNILFKFLDKKLTQLKI